MTFKTLIPVTAILALAMPAAQASAAQKSKFRFEQATYVVPEGAGSMDVVVTREATKGKRSSNKASLATVHYAITGGTATNGGDYAAVASGTLTFNPTVGKQTIHVTLNDDVDIEGLETIELRLSNASRNALIARPSQASVLVADNDGPTQIGIVPVQQNVSEADGTATFLGVRSGAIDISSSVHYATADGTATQPSDYTEQHGDLAFAVGDVVKQVDVVIKDDSVIEDPETLAVDLSGVSTGTTLGNAHASATIVDNDAPPLFSLDASSYRVNEDGSVDVTVNRHAGAGSPVGPNALFTVDFLAADGSATSPADYLAAQAPDSTLEFDPTDDAETITIAAAAAGTPAELMPAVALVDDALVEGDEAFGLSLGNPSSGAAVGSQGAATVTIADNDVPAATNASGQQSGTAGDGNQVVLGARQTGCGLTVKAAKKQKKFLKKKVLVLKLKSARKCTVTLRATVGKLKSKKMLLTLKPGKAKTLKLKFTKKTFAKVAKKLRPKKLLKAAIKISERDTAAKTKSRTVRVKVAR